MGGGSAVLPLLSFLIFHPKTFCQRRISKNFHAFEHSSYRHNFLDTPTQTARFFSCIYWNHSCVSLTFPLAINLCFLHNAYHFLNFLIHICTTYFLSVTFSFPPKDGSASG